MKPRIFAIADELAGDLSTQGSPADLVTRYAHARRAMAKSRWKRVKDRGGKK
jgi:hypothetical protein